MEDLKPKFTLPTWEIDNLDPWRGTDTENGEFTQLYVTRKGINVPCVAEIEQSGGDFEVGNCFDLHGNLIALTPKEKERAGQEWEEWQLKLAHKAEY